MKRAQSNAELGRPYWWEAAEPAATSDGLPERCDILVIGAGYTGLSAAIAAHDCGAKVAVVEAGIPGEGASTRNGGMFGAHPRLSWDKLAAKFGQSVADALFAEAPVALEWAKDFIEREEIACDLEQTGRLLLAWAPSHFEAQKRLAERVRVKSHAQVEVLERKDLGAQIETDQYFGGLLLPEHCGLHPAKYHAGMLAAVQKRGIPVVSHARVEGFARDGGRFEVQTAKGKVSAEKLILATNGYTTKPFKWHVRRVFPLPSYLIATEELPGNLLGHLAPGRRMMGETRARHSYFRLSPEGKRVVFGGRAAIRDLPIDQAAERLRRTMVEIWPALEDAKLSHAWTGYTGFSFNQMPHVGEQDGLCYAMGFSGSGTVMAPYLGAKAGYLAVGDARAETAYTKTAFSRNLVHFSEYPHFLKVADVWYRHWVDTRENRARKKGRKSV
ncbi:MAG: FAD-binding oxidoreductase [Pseudomonadota bacterium]